MSTPENKKAQNEVPLELKTDGNLSKPAINNNVDGYLQDVASFTDGHNLSLGELDESHSESPSSIVDKILSEKTKNPNVQSALDEVKGMPPLNAKEIQLLAYIIADLKGDEYDNTPDRIKDTVRMTYASFYLAKELGFSTDELWSSPHDLWLVGALQGVNDLKRAGVKIHNIDDDYSTVVYRLSYPEVIEGLLEKKGDYPQGIRASGVNWD